MFHDVGVPLFFTREEPVAEEFQFDMLHAVVIEDVFDFRQGPALEGVDQVGMPDADSFEADLGTCFHAGLEIEETVFVVGVWLGAACQRPIGGNQLDFVFHAMFRLHCCCSLSTPDGQ